MELNKERVMREIFEEFKKMDAFKTRFKNDFYAAFSSAITDIYQVQETDELIEFIDAMAEEALRLSNAVVEKDRTYPEYRQEMELKSFSVLLAKQTISSDQTVEIQKVKYELNKILLKYFPAIFELSSFGYRLLDRNVQYFAHQFTNAVRREANKTT
ncbi:hypothetical protein [Mangrovibacterium lignilyticum]|uniref:hypothetical protein n=1 Tax=Mangrovibacterium lignilyticum TaxID=2668052 RepID=UPI0013D8D6FE|nr:hypothetical protein [Mangrovibacterium lignilyticum]